MRLLLIPLIWSALPGGHQENDATHTCRATGVASLSVFTQDEVERGNGYYEILPARDLCLEKDLSPELDALLTRILRVHHSLASLLGAADFNEIFPEGIHLTLVSGNPLGNLDSTSPSAVRTSLTHTASQVRTNSILLTFLDQPVSDFDEHIYAHELGHALSTTKWIAYHHPVIQQNHEARDNSYSEYFAEWITLLLTGKNRSNPIYALADAWTTDGPESYDDPAYRFGQTFAVDRAIEYCNSQKIPPSTRVGAICETLRTRRGAQDPTEVLDKTIRFDPMGDRNRHDPHLIGVPFLHFLLRTIQEFNIHRSTVLNTTLSLKSASATQEHLRSFIAQKRESEWREFSERFRLDLLDRYWARSLERR